MNIKTFIVILFVLVSCNDNKKASPLELFTTQSELKEVTYTINEDSLALVEGIQCNDSVLIIIDYYLSKSFSLFDLKNGKYIGRFGTIGEGSEEIPLGCYGNIENSFFYISYPYTGLIGKYNLDSLRMNINSDPNILTKYNIPEAQLSQTMLVNDSIYLGAGAYKSQYQFVLFNKANKILDYKSELFDFNKEDINSFHIGLANQGTLKKHPEKNQFVFSLNMSSNIDFLEISNDTINIINSIRLASPRFDPMSDGKLYRVMPKDDNIIGYIDIAAGDKYVYALYTDKKLVSEDGEGEAFRSDIILLFDWNGQPIKKLKLTREAYYITVNERLGRLYAVVLNNDAGFTVTTYDIDALLSAH